MTLSIQSFIHDCTNEITICIHMDTLIEKNAKVTTELTSVARRFAQFLANVLRSEQLSGSNGFSKHTSKAYNQRHYNI